MIIFICGHKPTFDKFELHKPRLYLDNSQQYLDHRYYCELSALHKIWKQVKNVDYIGLEHYRRFFLKEPYKKGESPKLVDEEFVSTIMKSNDIILTRAKLPCNVMTWYSKEKHNILETSEGRTRILMYQWLMYIRDNYSSEFVDYIVERMLTHNTYMSCNMFIAKKEVIDRYCEFLFPYIEGFFTDIMKGIPEPRIFGYLSEYIMGYWMKWKNYKIHVCDNITVAP